MSCFSRRFICRACSRQYCIASQSAEAGYPGLLPPSLLYTHHLSHLGDDAPPRSASKDLDRLSKLGHFLKGSSASVGLVAVSKHCARMQNLGSCRDAESGTKKISEGDALRQIEALIKDLTAEQGRAKKWLEEFYKEEW